MCVWLAAPSESKTVLAFHMRVAQTIRRSFEAACIVGPQPVLYSESGVVPSPRTSGGFAPPPPHPTPQVTLPSYMAVTGEWAVSENWALQVAAVEPPERLQPAKTDKKRARRVRIPLWELFRPIDAASSWYVPLGDGSKPQRGGLLKATAPDASTTPPKRTASMVSPAPKADLGGALGVLVDGNVGQGSSCASSADGGQLGDLPPKPLISPGKLAALLKSACAAP